MVRLTKEQVSSYITVAFSSESMKAFMASCPSKDVFEDKLLKLSKFLFCYLTATGDLSYNSICKIIDDFTKFNGEMVDEYSGSYGELDDQIIYFKNHIFPIIIEKYREDNSKEGNLSLRDYISIYEQIYRTSRMNQFTTHSFPGALYDKVNENGLDISCELYKGEMRFLSSYGFRTVYQTGGLYLTNLSSHTIAYALRCPEKIRLSFSGLTDLEQQEGEMLFDYHKKVIQRFSNIFSNDILGRVACAYLNRINNFYFSNNNCCIAVVGNQQDVRDTKISKCFTYALEDSLPFSNLLSSDLELKALFEKTNELLKQDSEEGIDYLEKLITDMQGRYPDSEEIKSLKKKLEYEFFYNLKVFGLNCLKRGHGEGFRAKDGKVSRDEFSIATFVNPFVLYLQCKSEEQQVNHGSSIKR